MSVVKRKDAPPGSEGSVKSKKQKTVKPTKPTPDEAVLKHSNGVKADAAVVDEGAKAANPTKPRANGAPNGQFKLDTSSAEAHAKQREVAKERKAAKPNADAIERSKKLWERLRRKSHVPKEERKELVAELFAIIDGRVRDFVFKHDSVRVIQCALKYANQEQRRGIVGELKGDIRTLAESRYGKFLVAKMVVEGDQGIRDMVVPAFYGVVKRLINHPEASWIVDDIYRQVATPKQKAVMLREWYGPEFALFRNTVIAGSKDDDMTADLPKIIEKNPEKRKPILQHLLQMINSLIQKKMTGFTMLHDAMLQYFLALIPGSEEHNGFLEILKGDIETDVEKKQEGSTGGGDLFRNLAFTTSGSKLVCFSLAYGSAKDRKIILRCFRDTVELMAHDQYAKLVLIVGLDVPDDTKMSAKAIFPELLGQSIEDETQRLDRLEGIVTHLHARCVLLFPLAGMAKWLISDTDKALLEQVHKIRETTSKKTPDLRRKGLLESLSEPLLELVAKRAKSLVQSSFGCQFITETLLEANAAPREAAKLAVAEQAVGDPTIKGHIARNAAGGRMLKTLATGGTFDPVTKSTRLTEPRLKFAPQLYARIKPHLVEWACSASSFVVVALLESEDVDEAIKKDVIAALSMGKQRLEVAAKGSEAADENGEGAGTKKRLAKKINAPDVNGESKARKGGQGNAGSRMLLAKLET